MALTVTEDWIRERVGLKHNNLEDVRSLSLPGTYHEKINLLGDSLRAFSRLKSLDLSRNAIETIAGLETLKLLEKLNLYYNNVPNLQELYRLRFNQKLQELDLRLNPVARNEPDYRLFLIHMLPNLRRLDDRAVRDSERKAALMHFTTDQARELTEHAPPTPPPENKPNPRVEHVKSLAKPGPIMSSEDDDVIDLVNRKQGDLSQPRQITGSQNTDRAMEDFNPETLRNMNVAGEGLAQGYPSYPDQPMSMPPMPQRAPPEGDYPPQFVNNKTGQPIDVFRAKYPNLPAVSFSPPPESTTNQDTQGNEQQKKNRVQFSEDPNLQYQDEVEAYTSYKAQGFFTPNPASNEGATIPQDVTKGNANNDLPDYNYVNPNRGVELYDPKDNAPSQPLPPPSRPQRNLPDDAQIQGTMKMGPPLSRQQEDAEVASQGEYGKVILKVSQLADKYWNGARSLLRNDRFKSQMSGVVKDLFTDTSDAGSVSTFAGANASLEFEVSRLRHQLDKARRDNEDMKERLFTGSGFNGGENPDESGDTRALKSTLVRAQRDVKILRDKLQKSVDENRNLQEQIDTGVASVVAKPSKQQIQITQQEQDELDAIKRDNSGLKEQIGTLNIRLKQAGQMQELAHMLQDSHKSLVQTNEHLLKELDETRKRHQDEVRQLNWSYQQLKKSTAYKGPSVSLNGGE